MRNWLKLLTWVGMVAIGLVAGSCFAAGNMMNTTDGDEAHEQSWKREQKVGSKSEAESIVQQKAQAQAEQRAARLATSSWYGISNSRPSGSTTPFMSRYGTVWEMPGCRPYSWTPTWSRPTHVFAGPYYY